MVTAGERRFPLKLRGVAKKERSAKEEETCCWSASTASASVIPHANLSAA